MITLLSNTKRVARKEYTCNACEWVDNVLLPNIWEYKLTLSELREIVKARRNRWRIMPGQQYVKQVFVDYREFRVFRAIPTIHDICLKYDLYPDD